MMIVVGVGYDYYNFDELNFVTSISTDKLARYMVKQILV